MDQHLTARDGHIHEKSQQQLHDKNVSQADYFSKSPEMNQHIKEVSVI